MGRSLPELVVEDLFDDSFQAIARDGTACLEVGLRLQKGLSLLSRLPERGVHEAARNQAFLALHHGEKALRLAQEVEGLRLAARCLPAAGPGASLRKSPEEGDGLRWVGR